MEPYKARMGDLVTTGPGLIDVRYIDRDPFNRQDNPADGQRVWMRADGKLPDDPTLHACIVTYAQRHDAARHDHDAAVRAVVGQPRTCRWPASIAAMWFHAPFNADDWLLYDQKGVVDQRWPWAGGQERSSPMTARWL